MRTNRKSNIIFAVSPGTRETGVAVFEGLDLLYYGVKETGKHRGAARANDRAAEVTSIVERLIRKRQPNVLATVRLNALQRRSAKLKLTVEQVIATSRRYGLLIYQRSPLEVRKGIYGQGRATKQKVAEELAILYPELSRYVSDVSQWQRLYYAPMLDAIACGYACARELERRVGSEGSNTLKTSERDANN